MPGLNVVQLTVNNEAIGIKPNSFSYKTGRGERRVRTKMSGSNIRNGHPKSSHGKLHIRKLDLPLGEL